MGHHSGRGTTAAAMVYSVLELQQYLRLVAMCLERRNILIPTYGTIIDASTYNCNTNCIQIVKYEFVHGVVFVRIHTNEFIQLFVVFVRMRIKSYNFYTNCIVRIHTKCDFYVFSKSVQTSCEGEARAHLLPQPGHT